jgi:hypothetical protein
MQTMKSLRLSTWAIPILLFLMSATALVLALVAEGIWDWLSWLLLAIPLGIIVVALLARNNRIRR